MTSETPNANRTWSEYFGFSSPAPPPKPVELPPPQPVVQAPVLSNTAKTADFSAVLAGVPKKFNLEDYNKDKLQAMGTDAGTGALFGFASGYATKKAGKVALFAVGAGVAGLQLLQNSGVVQVDWLAIDRNTKKYVDLNNDGKVDIKDLEVMVGDASTYLSKGMPFAGGFGGGFLAGLKYG